MSKKTVLNDEYRGLVEAMSIPAELHERDGRKYASFGSAVPLHSVSKDQLEELSKTTHHYSDILTEQELQPLGELAYVRLDEDTAEKVFINRTKRILVVSSDGRLAQWRAAPTFESDNRFLAGAPLVAAGGGLLSLVTARRGNHYAISNIDGPGGYFDTPAPWKVVGGRGGLVYADNTFPSREALRAHVASLPPFTSADTPFNSVFTPCLHLSPAPRITLVASTGRQIAHTILHGVLVDNIEYL